MKHLRCIKDWQGKKWTMMQDVISTCEQYIVKVKVSTETTDLQPSKNSGQAH